MTVYTRESLPVCFRRGVCEMAAASPAVSLPQ